MPATFVMNNPTRRKRVRTNTRNPELAQYRRKHLGINTDLSADQRIGEFKHDNPDQVQQRLDTGQTHCNPSSTELRTRGFGKPSKDHSFTVEASGEAILILLFKSRMLDEATETALRSVHVLVNHLAATIKRLQHTNFDSISQYNKTWQTQEQIPPERAYAFLACLLHYDGRVGDVMRYASNNYTGEYRKVTERVEKLRHLVDDDLLARYIRVMTTGAPAHFNTETTRDNAMLHWRMGNHSSIKEHNAYIDKLMNKEEKNCFVMIFPQWIARFLPDIFFTPQHLMIKNGKKRLIYDGSRRFTPTSIPINMMTSTKTHGRELACIFGDTLLKLLVRVWNLRITYPTEDIVIHANDVKSCFRQLKHHPDVVGAFSYIIGDYLYAQCGLPFGADFSPSTWEILRRMAEQMVIKLFDDEALVEKHKQYLDKLQWSKRLGNTTEMVRAQACSINKGVLDEHGQPLNTPHYFFVDDGVMAEVYDRTRIHRAEAASIETLFLLLGETDLQHRQDPVSWDKLLEMILHFMNIAIGVHINTRTMRVGVPHDYITALTDILGHWHKKRKSFTILEIERVVGKLNHAANIVPWLKHIMGHLYTSLAAALGQSKSHLIKSSRSFRNLMEMIKREPCTEEEALISSFAVGQSASRIHRSKQAFYLNRTAIEEFQIIRQAIADPTIDKTCPIAHLVPKEPDAECSGDSSLDSAGGWSIDMEYWWYIEWPQQVRQNTLRFIKNNKNGKLIAINALEYAASLINYAAAFHFWVNLDNINKRGIQYPTVRSKVDNKTAIAWLDKGCKVSAAGRALGRLQCALLINSPVGLDPEYIDTKSNVIADEISRIKQETNIITEIPALLQKYPSLEICKRFHPSQELISNIMDALLSKLPTNPLTIRQVVQENPGKIAG